MSATAATRHMHSNSPMLAIEEAGGHSPTHALARLDLEGTSFPQGLTACIRNKQPQFRYHCFCVIPVTIFVFVQHYGVGISGCCHGTVVEVIAKYSTLLGLFIEGQSVAAVIHYTAEG